MTNKQMAILAVVVKGPVKTLRGNANIGEFQYLIDQGYVTQRIEGQYSIFTVTKLGEKAFLDGLKQP